MIGVDRIAGWMRRRRARRRRLNPYIAGTPVFDTDLFFGRHELTRRTLRRLDAGSVALTGERRIGKTSFLYHLHGVLAAGNGGPRRSFPVFVDLEGVTAPGLLRALIEEAAEALAPSPRTLAELAVTSEQGEYDADDFSHDLARMIEDLRRRTGEPVRLVFLIDEIDAIREQPQAPGDEWLRPLLVHGSREVRVVLAGVRRCPGEPVEARRRNEALEVLELSPLTRDEAEALVKRPVAGVFRYEPAAVERILELGRGRPYLIQRICLHAVNRMLDEGRTTIRLADVEAAAGPDSSRAVQPFSATERHENEGIGVRDSDDVGGAL